MKLSKTLSLFLLCLTLGLTSCEKDETPITPSSPEEQSVTLTEDVLNELIKEAQEETKNDRNSLAADVQTVDFVDLERYSGRWFELANFPEFFNITCKCTTADYTPSATGVSLLNNCTSLITGDFTTITGNATVVDTVSNAKLQINFDNIPFPGTYWIIDLVAYEDDAPYDFAVVGEPTRESLFILSRSSKLNSFKERRTFIRLLIRLIRQGYDLRKLKISPQLNDCTYI